jgi:hypothetical protein
MGKTYKKQPSKFDEEFASRRSGKNTNSRKSGGMKTLNSYVDEDLDDDPFVDDVGLEDEIFIQHIQKHKP